MSVLYRSSSVQAPTAAPTVSGSGVGFIFAHRRVNLNGTFSKISPVTVPYNFPVTLTPQSYADTGQLLRDEFIVSNDAGVTWRIIPRNGTLTGAQTVTAYSGSWAITSIVDNQSTITTPQDLGVYDSDGSNLYTFYAYNNGTNSASLTASVIDLDTGVTAVGLSGLVQISLTGIFVETGVGTPSTTQNKSILWNVDGGIANYFPVTLPSKSFARFTVQLINYPSNGGLSSTINIGVELTSNQRTYTIPYTANWYSQTFLYNPSLGFSFPYIAEEGTALTVTLKPLAFNYDGIAVVNSTDANFLLPSDGTYNVLVSRTGIFSIVDSSISVPTNNVALLQFAITGTSITSVVVNYQINPKIYTERPLGDITGVNRFGLISNTGELDYVALGGDTPEVITVNLEGQYTTNSVCIVDSADTIVPGDKVYSDTTGKAVTGTGNTPWRALSSATNGFPLLVDYVFVAPSGTGLTTEDVEDLIGTRIVEGTDIDVTYDDISGETTISYTGTSLDVEDVEDIIGTKLIGGVDIDVTYDDISGETTIDYIGLPGGLDQEEVEDLIGTKVIGGTDIDVTYNDTTGETTIDYTGSGGGGVSGDILLLRDTTPPTIPTATNQTITLTWDTIAYNSGFTYTAPSDTFQVPSTDIYEVTVTFQIESTGAYNPVNSRIDLVGASIIYSSALSTEGISGGETLLCTMTYIGTLSAGQNYQIDFFKVGGSVAGTVLSTTNGRSPTLLVRRIEATGATGDPSLEHLVLNDTTPPTFTISGAETVTFSFDTVVLNSGFTYSAPSSVITIPSTGLYLVEFQMHLRNSGSNAAVTHEAFVIRTNGTPTTIVRARDHFFWYNPNDNLFSTQRYVNLTAGDTLEMRFTKGGIGSAVTFQQEAPQLSIKRIS